RRRYQYPPPTTIRPRPASTSVDGSGTADTVTVASAPMLPCFSEVGLPGGTNGPTLTVYSVLPICFVTVSGVVNWWSIRAVPTDSVPLNLPEKYIWSDLPDLKSVMYRVRV